MTTSSAPVQPIETPQPPSVEMVRINVVCIGCSASASIWVYSETITPQRFVWSPFDQVYLHTCGKCRYQTTDTIPTQPRKRDPERAAHERRKSGYTTDRWHAARGL